MQHKVLVTSSRLSIPTYNFYFSRSPSSNTPRARHRLTRRNTRYRLTSSAGSCRRRIRRRRCPSMYRYLYRVETHSHITHNVPVEDTTMKYRLLPSFAGSCRRNFISRCADAIVNSRKVWAILHQVCQVRIAKQVSSLTVRAFKPPIRRLIS